MARNILDEMIPDIGAEPLRPQQYKLASERVTKGSPLKLLALISFTKSTNYSSKPVLQDKACVDYNLVVNENDSLKQKQTAK